MLNSSSLLAILEKITLVKFTEFEKKFQTLQTPLKNAFSYFNYSKITASDILFTTYIIFIKNAREFETYKS